MKCDFDGERLSAICRRYQVLKLELFGSRARDEARDDSDVDILVTFEPGADLGLEYFRFGMELEELFGHPVDLIERPVVERDRNPFFKRNVLREVETLYDA